MRKTRFELLSFTQYHFLNTKFYIKRYALFRCQERIDQYDSTSAALGKATFFHQCLNSSFSSASRKSRQSLLSIQSPKYPTHLQTHPIKPGQINDLLSQQYDFQRRLNLSDLYLIEMAVVVQVRLKLQKKKQLTFQLLDHYWIPM